MLRRIVPYLRVALPETTAGALLLLAATGLGLLQPWPVKWLIDGIFGGQPLPAWLLSLWPPLTVPRSLGAVAGIGVAVILIGVCQQLLTMASQLLLIRAGERVVMQLRCAAAEQVHRLSLLFHDRTQVGDSLYRVAYDTYGAQTLLANAIVPVATGVLIFAGVLLIMLRLDLWLTLVTLAVAPLLWLIIRLSGRGIEEQTRAYRTQEGSLAAFLQQSLSSIRVIQAFNLEPQIDQRFVDLAQGSRQANNRKVRLELLFSAGVGVALVLGSAAVISAGALRVLQGHLWPGDILVFLAYLGMLYQPLSTISQSANVIHAASAQLGRVFELLDQPRWIEQRPHGRRLSRVRGELRFRAVSFAYEPGQPVLRAIDFTVEPGQVLGIAGRTGAGKSTLASLVVRFYDPDEGAVLLDGHDLRELDVTWLRAQISIVLQEPLLFAESIAENIAYGRLGATRADIERAAQLAQIDDFIRKLPEGYDTPLGERGVNLSGGQRQRIAIARAFLRDAPILILDEPTSALDVETEAALLSALGQLMVGRTTILISHRQTALSQAQRVLLLQRGRMLEQDPAACIGLTDAVSTVPPPDPTQ